MTEDEMVGWHHRLDRHVFGWTPGVGDGQGDLACYGSWGRKELDTTEGLNWIHTKALHVKAIFTRLRNLVFCTLLQHIKIFFFLRFKIAVAVVWSLSCVRLLAILWTAARQASLSFHYFLESAQTHEHWVGDATQLSHPLLPPSRPALNCFQHQGLFQWVTSSHQVAKG